MRPCSLEFCSINSFSEPARIDFDDLLQYGIFGVFGDTGSGKSTILDCISFALYGSVSRSRTGSIADIIHYSADSAYVHYEFEIVYDGKRRKYRVERELKRKNAAQSVKVYEREEGALRVIADGVRECNECLVKIIGLEQKDFEKCIALPQGEFAQFVKAPRGERLKLLSRLFDLENYGERLYKKVNARCMKLKGEQEVTLARLEPFAELSKEALLAAQAEREELEAREKETRAALASERAEEKALSEKVAKKIEAERVAREIEELEKERESIEELEHLVGLIPKAQAVVAAAREKKRREELLCAFRKDAEEKREAVSSARRAEEKFSQFDEEASAAEINGLTERRARVEQDEKRRKRVEELTVKLETARSGYASESAAFRGFSYEAERERIEERLQQLGDGDFFAFLREHAEELFSGEYRKFYEELCALHEKYPEAEDLIPLIEKYQKLSLKEGNLTDIEAAYLQAEKERKALRGELVSLEKRNGLYQTHRARLQQLQTEGAAIREELISLGESSEGESLSRAQIEELLKERQALRRSALEGRAQAQRARAEGEIALASAEEKCRAAEENFASCKESLKIALAEGNFGCADEAQALLARSDSEEQAKARIKRFRDRDAALTQRRQELSGENFEGVSKERLFSLRQELAERETAHEELLKTLALKRETLSRMEEGLAKKEQLLENLKETERDLTISERLRSLLEGNKFMEFVAEEYLESVTVNASGRLLQLTSGRYFLHYDRGFFVGDNLAGGKLRAVYTLSGGETFLVSLSLALALSAEVYAKSLRPIEFFFLDEGFGTLDGRLVDTVMDSLEKLKGEHFSIGIISHVEELKHRIEKKLIVEKANEQHGSRITAN